MFDTIPRWFSKETLQGFAKTKHYQSPPMPWGVNRNEIEPTLKSWSPRVERVEAMSYRAFRGLPGQLLPLFSRLPVLRNTTPTIVRVYTR